ncbi:MAG: DUF1294 domain-containing protein [Oscillospiraceae bacterium]|nr:DUF1294 domain-containing protein [Oscillospiraceae bacterium]
MMSFENSPQMLEIKAGLREMFFAILDTVTGAFKAFYEYLKEAPIPAPPTMMKLFSNNKANLILFTVFVAYIIFINVRAYVVFAADKRYAQRNQERVPEKTLFKYMWVGGAAGSGLSMLMNRHKTQHANFVATAAVLVVIQLILFSFILGYLGFWTFF